ncbi:MAG TPA: hypothetical protein VG097_17895 [Gemmata sp.]|nr:hypothetical protein [Gemmata sp.]
MLFGKTRSVSWRISLILISLTAITLALISVVAVGAGAGLWLWPPQPSSVLGIACGLAAGFIVFFEMALLPRKWCRGRSFGATRKWMKWHIWLGIVCLPVVLIHAGFGFGGPLSTVTLVLFLAVTVSGVWGLAMQQWLPDKMLRELTSETVASQIDFLGGSLVTQATSLVEGLVSVPPEATSSQPIVISEPRAALLEFRDRILLPYLRGGKRTGSPLASKSEAELRIARLRDVLPVGAHQALGQLRELADLRRQWDAQARLNFWLHNWLLIHLPLSVAMTGLMILHAIRALKYW